MVESLFFLIHDYNPKYMARFADHIKGLIAYSICIYIIYIIRIIHTSSSNLPTVSYSLYMQYMYIYIIYNKDHTHS